MSSTRGTSHLILLASLRRVCTNILLWFLLHERPTVVCCLPIEYEKETGLKWSVCVCAYALLIYTVSWLVGEMLSILSNQTNKPHQDIISCFTVFSAWWSSLSSLCSCFYMPQTNSSISSKDLKSLTRQTLASPAFLFSQKCSADWDLVNIDLFLDGLVNRCSPLFLEAVNYFRRSDVLDFGCGPWVFWNHACVFIGCLLDCLMPLQQFCISNQHSST